MSIDLAESSPNGSQIFINQNNASFNINLSNVRKRHASLFPSLVTSDRMSNSSRKHQLQSSPLVQAEK